MAKKNMNLKYKSPKRERKNKDEEKERENYIKNTIKSICGVIIFFGCAYLIVLGMEKLGIFEAGYTAPDKEDAQVNYEYISTGMVFNRPEKTYYVIFDDYDFRGCVLHRYRFNNSVIDVAEDYAQCIESRNTIKKFF